MNILGLRCSSKDYSYALVAGTKSYPLIHDHSTVEVPNGYARSHLLKWFYQELDDLCRRHLIDKLCIKGTEPMATKDSSFTERVEMEAMAFLVAYNTGNKPIFRRVKATIAKNLGLKGKPKYLKTTLDTSCIPGFQEKSEKLQEAILVAWSELT